MFETQKSRQIAEGAATIPGLLATLYAAIAYDRGADPDGFLVGIFSYCVDLQLRLFGGETYSPKLAILLMIIPLGLPPYLAVKFWLSRRATAAAPSVAP